MVKCPVCNDVGIDNCNVEFEMMVDGIITQVCGDCYHEAFLKTNLKRMLSNRNNRGGLV
jgi:transcription elongation factor Elf1